jgi:hypothetical protein
MDGLEKAGKTRKIRHSPVFWIIIVCLVISLTALVLYILDLNYSDAFLFSLLAVLRYSSFFLCVCSFYRLMLSIYRVFRRRSVLLFTHIFMYIVFIVYGLSIFFIEAFINVIAGGNG